MEAALLSVYRAPPESDRERRVKRIARWIPYAILRMSPPRRGALVVGVV